ncbi:hypothetical protein GLYMA_10G232251v4 [Glycine max]|nr:hypothetical protein GLYMA_10G232251v4 [Glycine max]KAH1139701.1 hypothetical protein GYH30_028876 [Glycine max]
MYFLMLCSFLCSQNGLVTTYMLPTAVLEIRIAREVFDLSCQE